MMPIKTYFLFDQALSIVILYFQLIILQLHLIR